MPIETAIIKQLVRKGDDTATDKAVKQLGKTQARAVAKAA